MSSSRAGAHASASRCSSRTRRAVQPARCSASRAPSRSSPNWRPSRRASVSPSVDANTRSPAAERRRGGRVHLVLLDAERQSVPPSSRCPPPRRISSGGGWPALHQRIRARRSPHHGRARTSSLEPPRSSALVCAITSAGSAASHVRASTKKRTIELIAATSIPLPLRRPPGPPRIRSAAARCRRVAAAGRVFGGLVHEPGLEAVELGQRTGMNPRVSASAIRRSRGSRARWRWRPPRPSPKAFIRASSASSQQLRALVGDGEHPEQPRADRERHGANEPIPSSSPPRGGTLAVDLRLAYGRRSLRRGRHPLADDEALRRMRSDRRSSAGCGGDGWPAPGGGA